MTIKYIFHRILINVMQTAPKKKPYLLTTGWGDVPKLCRYPHVIIIITHTKFDLNTRCGDIASRPIWCVLC